MSFALLQTYSLSPMIQFSATIERWSSSFNAELSAIVIAVLLSPPLALQHLFKSSSCNHLWSILFDALFLNKITLSLHKVLANSGDPNND
ncbi:hypothetical protein RCL_jg23003.t1 [Rhizophagus clarus]|uniref:Uncharacterized protein n=1 Tax=Rhizophagus clarus TaxID=94130 RepID=A0A8H3QGJ0_9GLOM|nr:hypothetical protein RCL_jg23003.t1 [Rhizophagus clarus]